MAAAPDGMQAESGRMDRDGLPGWSLSPKEVSPRTRQRQPTAQSGAGPDQGEIPAS